MEDCGTVAPGYQNECCKRKGYYAWNAEEFECENKDEINECEEWNAQDGVNAHQME